MGDKYYYLAKKISSYDGNLDKFKDELEKLYQKGSELNHSQSMIELARRYIWKFKYDEAYELLERAFKLNNPNSLLIISNADMWNHKFINLIKDVPDTNKEAMYMIAKVYVNKLDPERSLYWYQRAAELGHIEAMKKITGYLKDPVKIKYWYKKASLLGDDEAMYELGEFYQQTLKENKALIWYERAAKLGHKEAMDKVIDIYLQKGEDDKAVEYILMINKLKNLDNIKLDNLKLKYMMLEETNNMLQSENKTLQNENIELKYQPGGPGYQQAKQHFESLKN